MDFGNGLAYDPDRKQLVKVPAGQIEMLQNAGYLVGDEAKQRADADGWGGTALAFANGIASGGTAGTFDWALPNSAAKMIKVAKEAHPAIAALGQVAGTGAMIAATSGLGAVAGPAARMLHGIVSGGMQEVNRAKLHNEPIQWERVRSGITLGGIFGAVAEGLPFAIAGGAKVAQKSLGALAARWPREVGRDLTEAAESMPAFSGPGPRMGPPGLPSAPSRAFAEMPEAEYAAAKGLPDAAELTASASRDGLKFGPAEKGAYKRLFGDVGVGKALVWGALPAPLKAAAGGAIAADRILTKSLNHLKEINEVLDNVSEGPIAALAKTARVLVSTGGEYATPYAMPDPDKDFARKQAMVQHVASNPEAFADAFTHNIGPALGDHLLLQMGMLTNTLNAFDLLNQALPKDPSDPTIAGAAFKPTKKQKQEWLDLYHSVDSFAESMKRPTPTKVAIAEQVNPEQLKLLRQTLIGHLNTKGAARLSLSQRRNISIILGMPIVPELAPSYIQRLQATSVPPVQAPRPRGGGLGTKVQTAVTMRDMPDNMRLQMGV